ncbi:MAG: DUF1573 domain-containing protein [Candidatus Aerophobetes bacterium]|nr:DUF1573 domain-containing protein [Candidatus Aerophobetes bacterium]
MKKITWLVVLILVVNGGFVVRALPAQETSPPDIEFSEELWDFGTIKEGEKVTHTFEVRNLGGAKLVIGKVRTSCGCAAALVSSQEVAPGGSGQIKVIFDSSGYKGKISKNIYVESNDPDELRKVLTIKANVEVSPKPTIKLMENSWDFGLITEGRKLTYILSVKNTGEQELVVSKISTSSHYTHF